jgi:hypothetical protein
MMPLVSNDDATPTRDLTLLERLRNEVEKLHSSTILNSEQLRRLKAQQAAQTSYLSQSSGGGGGGGGAPNRSRSVPLKTHQEGGGAGAPAQPADGGATGSPTRSRFRTHRRLPPIGSDNSPPMRYK